MARFAFLAVYCGVLGALTVACGDSAAPAEPMDGDLNQHEDDAGHEVQGVADAGHEGDENDSGTSEDTHSCPEGQIWCDICIDEIAPTAEAVQTRILAGSCALSRSCHGGVSPQEGLGLASVDDLFANAVGKSSKQRSELSLIEPGKPGESYLVHKLRNLDLAAKSSTGKASTQMPPPPGDPLCEAKIQALEAWIAAGAVR